MAVRNSPLGELEAIKKIAERRQAMGAPPPGGGQTPMPSQGVGPAALGGMKEEELKQGFAQEAAMMSPSEPPMMSPPQEEKKTMIGRGLQKVVDEVLLSALERGFDPDLKDKMDRKKEEGDKIIAAAEIRKDLVDENVNAIRGGLPINAQANISAALENPETAARSGGLMGMAAGGGFVGQVPGIGHGMEDNVYMPIVERQAGQQIGTLAVSPDEYVVDAHTMSALGNGSADAGAKVMDQVVDGVRKKAFGTDKQPNQINGLAALRPMIERA